MTDKSKRSIIYPFHKEGWKTMSGHLIISWMVGSHHKPYKLSHLHNPRVKSLYSNILLLSYVDPLR